MLVVTVLDSNALVVEDSFKAVVSETTAVTE